MKRCEACGYSEHPEIIQRHHIIPRSKGGGNGKENMMNLCPNCHALKHLADKKKYFTIEAKLKARSANLKRYRQRHPERVKKISRQYYYSDKGQKRLAEYLDKNRDRRNAYFRKRYAAKKEAIREYRRKYFAIPENREKKRRQGRKYYLKKRGKNNAHT